MMKGDTKEYIKALAVSCTSVLAACAIGILVLVCCTSCKSSGCTITESDFLHDTIVVNRIKHDSIHIKDSIYITEKTKGDTVYLTTDRWHTQFKECVKHDSKYIHLADTIVKKVPVEVAPKKTWWQKVTYGLRYMALGGILSLIGLALFCWYRGK